ncbi:MAG: site-2 protease family protein, partial [Oscillospiraceae bacterium]
AAHEVGHLSAMLLCKKRVESVSLFTGRLEIKPCTNLLTNREAIIILISGSSVNLLLAVLFSALQMKNEMLINLMLGIFNLLPAGELDGGRIFRLLLESKLSENIANAITLALSFLISVILMSFGFLILFKSVMNPTLLIIGIYIFVTTIKNIRYTN